jgi:hypothetical protein
LLHIIKQTCAADLAQHHQEAPEDLTAGRPHAGRGHDLLTDFHHPPTVTGDGLGRPSVYVLASGRSAMSPRAVALRGDLPQAELKTAWNAGLNDAARRHPAASKFRGEIKNDP